MKDYIIEHYRRYPEMEIQDMVKMLYQNEFGPGHMVTDQAASLERLQKELRDRKRKDDRCCGIPHFEPLGNGLSRLYLDGVENWFHPETVNRFFVITAPKVKGTMEGFEKKLDLFLGLSRSGLLPYPKEEVTAYLEDYRSAGCPAVGHSAAYRKAYCPSYRVVSDEYRKYWEVFSRIDRTSPQIAAIDGKSGSGKSSLGSLIQEVYGCNLFHMDDFFLRPEQKTADRLSEIGGNVDYERFLDQVIKPLSEGDPEFTYQIYDCCVEKLTEARTVSTKPLAVVEGSYSCHPVLERAYGLKIFLDINCDEQRERILRRNGEQMLERFLGEWIPKENAYFAKFGIQEKCDLTY